MDRVLKISAMQEKLNRKDIYKLCLINILALFAKFAQEVLKRKFD